MRLLNEEFRESFARIVALARNRGLDTAETLNVNGMLRTPQFIKVDQSNALNSLQNQLHDLTPEKLLALMGRDSGQLTPAEMFRLTVAWIDTYIATWEKEE